jgi:sugar diacid utilization regulator
MRQETDVAMHRLEARLGSGGPSQLDYDLAANHLAVIVTGPEPKELIRRLADQIGRDLLLLSGGEEETSAWWGGEEEFDEEDLAAISAAALPREGRLALGEPARGPAGWRLSLRQARTAFGFRESRPRRFVRYREVALLAAAAGDDGLGALLRQSFLEPLLDRGPGGLDLARALRAYLDAGGDISSTALALGLPRQAVVDRLSGIEERIGRSPLRCLAELDLALRLHETHWSDATDPKAHAFRRLRPGSAQPR